LVPTESSREWKQLFDAIAAGDEAAGEVLYRRFARVQSFFARRLPPDESEDRFHDVMLAVLRAVRLGSIREPDKLRAYVWATAQRILVTRLSSLISERESTSEVRMDALQVHDLGPDPEAAAIRQENREIALRVLAALPPRHREVLIRYYLIGQPSELIRSEMGLTQTQYRLTKSKAKGKLISRLHRQLARDPEGSICDPPPAPDAPAPSLATRKFSDDPE
jgi:RNA polymerase sigma factor (sigma-70 family)